MTALDQLRRLWQHLRWANAEIARALRGAPVEDAAARREFAHLVGAEEVWLARLERRPARAAVWPDLPLDAAVALAADTVTGYHELLARLRDDELGAPVAYTNSAGQAFETPAGDILLHVALHGQYHRGKLNLLLRQGGKEPAPVDYIAFVRGSATTRTAPPGPAPDGAPLHPTGGA